MKIRFALAGLLFAAMWCFAQTPVAPTGLHVVTNAPGFLTNVIVPLDRMPPGITGGPFPWNPGIPGGIPTYPNCVNVMNYGAKADGVTDDSAAFNSAISACTNGGAVYAPAGVYLLNSTISFSSSKRIVIRGAGPTQTRILSYGSSGAFYFGGNTSRTSQNVTGGYTRGSTNLTVASTSGLVPGQIVRFMQQDDPSEVFGSLGQSGGHQAQMFRILSISGNTLTIDTPIIYEGYSSTFSPYLEQFHNAAYRCGLEDLGIYYYGGFQNNVYLYIVDQCWVRNIASTNAVHGNIQLVEAYQSVVRDSQTYYHQVYDSDARYGVQLGQHSTACLVENNIIQGNNCGIVLQYGVTANVIAYNFSDMGFGNGYPTDNSCKGGIASHGDNANFNLYEGNVTPWFSTDEYWGDNRTSTVFRNWLTRKSYYNTSGGVSGQGFPGVFIDSTNYYHSVVGNIVGTPRDTGDTSSSHTSFDIGYARRAGYDYPSTVKDANAALRSFIHGNYDFVNQQTSWSNSVPQVLPSSYYLSSKPAWFGSLPWPPIGPDVNTSSSITSSPVIPAQARALGVSY